MMIRMVLMMALLSAPFPQPGLASDIPRAAERHRAELIRVSRAVWGLEAPVAVFAAQVHAAGGATARCPRRAQGLAQFLPSTAEWLPRAVPELEREAGRPAPFNPGWALRALVSYDKWLWDRLNGADACQRMAFTLSAYNGGIGWVGRDRKEAERQGRDPARWFGQVEKVNAGRSASSLRENRRYVRLILLEGSINIRRGGAGVGCGGAMTERARRRAVVRRAARQAVGVRRCKPNAEPCALRGRSAPPNVRRWPSRRRDGAPPELEAKPNGPPPLPGNFQTRNRLAANGERSPEGWTRGASRHCAGLPAGWVRLQQALGLAPRAPKLPLPPELAPAGSASALAPGTVGNIRDGRPGGSFGPRAGWRLCRCARSG
ncbi:MAG: transglycosylase SLT domain-containing protein [Bilophila wadsworthia]